MVRPHRGACSGMRRLHARYPAASRTRRQHRSRVCEARRLRGRRGRCCPWCCSQARGTCAGNTLRVDRWPPLFHQQREHEVDRLGVSIHRSNGRRASRGGAMPNDATEDERRRLHAQVRLGCSFESLAQRLADLAGDRSASDAVGGGPWRRCPGSARSHDSLGRSEPHGSGGDSFRR